MRPKKAGDSLRLSGCFWNSARHVSTHGLITWYSLCLECLSWHDLLSHLFQVFAKASHLPDSFPDYLYYVQTFPLPSQYNLPELFYILVAVRWIWNLYILFNYLFSASPYYNASCTKEECLSVLFSVESPVLNTVWVFNKF